VAAKPWLQICWIVLNHLTSGGYGSKDPDDTTSNEEDTGPAMRTGASKAQPAPEVKRQLMSHGVALQMKAKQPIMDALESLSAEKASERTAK
jgi:hypothetical protein